MSSPWLLAYGNSGQGIADPGSVELTDVEVIALVERFGFRVESRESGIEAGYIQDPSSMLQSLYRVSHWVARKV
jgi:carnosine N-methyltransferase